MDINLKLLEESDFGQIVSWVNNHNKDFMVQWAGFTYTYPLSVEQMKAHYHRGLNSLEADVFIYKIVDASTTEMMGSVQLCRFDLSKNEAVIGRFIIGDPSHRGSGIGTLSLKRVVQIGFSQFGLKRIKLNVFDVNHAAIRCYERVGFKREGISQNVYTSSQGVQWNNWEMVLTLAANTDGSRQGFGGSDSRN